MLHDAEPHERHDDVLINAKQPYDAVNDEKYDENESGPVTDKNQL